MEENETQKFWWCFISYRHSDNDLENDRGWASWIHKEIERYEVPAELVGTENKRGDIIPERIYPVFRDEDSLSSDASLSESISIALEKSRVLLVLCSPRAVESQYVTDEILTFKRLGREDRIIAAIISGVPGDEARNPFPLPLLHPIDEGGNLDLSKRTEPIAADFRLRSGEEGFTSSEAYGLSLQHSGDVSRKALRKEIDTYNERIQLMKLKIIAGILGISIEELHDRDHAHQLALAKRRSRILKLWIGALTAIAILALIGGLLAVLQRNRARLAEQETERQLVVAEAERTRAEAEKARAQEAEAEANVQLRESRHQLGRVWLERAIKAPNSLDAALAAARSVGFTGIGREVLNNRNLEKLPVLLKEQSGEFRIATSIATTSRFAEPVWSDAPARINGNYFFSEDETSIFFTPSISARAHDGSFKFTEFDISTGEVIAKHHRTGIASYGSDRFRLNSGRVLEMNSQSVILNDVTNTKILSEIEYQVGLGVGRRQVVFSNDRSKIALVTPPPSVGVDNQHFNVNLFTIDPMELTGSFKVTGKKIPSSWAFAQNGAALLFVDHENKLKRMNTFSGELETLQNFPAHPRFEAIASLACGKLFLIGEDYSLFTASSPIERPSRIRDASVPGRRAFDSDSRRIAVSPRERFFVWPSTPDSVEVLDAKSNQTVHEEKNLPRNDSPVFRFSHSSKYLVKGGRSSISLWTTKGWRLEPEIRIDGSGSYLQHVSDNGEYIASFIAKVGTQIESTRSGGKSFMVDVNSAKATFLGNNRILVGNVEISLPSGDRRLVSDEEMRKAFVDRSSMIMVKSESGAEVEIREKLSGRVIRTIAPETQQRMGGANSREFILSPDGRIVATWQNGDYHFDLIDVVTGKTMATLRCHKDDVIGGVFSSNGEYFLTRGRYGERILWRLTVPPLEVEQEFALEGMAGSLDWVDENRIIIKGLAGATMTPTTLRFENGKIVGKTQYKKTNGKQFRGALTITGNEAMGNSMGDKLTQVFDSETGVQIRTIDFSKPMASDLRVLPNGRVVASSMLAPITLHEANSLKQLVTLADSNGMFNLFDSANGRWLVASGLRQTGKMWDLSDPKKVPFALDDGIRGTKPSDVVFSRDESAVYVSFGTDAIYEWDLSAGGPNTPKKHVFEGLAINRFALSEDERFILIGERNGGGFTELTFPTGEKKMKFSTGAEVLGDIAYGQIENQFLTVAGANAGNFSLQVWTRTLAEDRAEQTDNYLGRLVESGFATWDEDTGKATYLMGENLYTGRHSIHREMKQVE